MKQLDVVLRPMRSAKLVEVIHSLAQTALVNSAVIATDQARDDGYTRHLLNATDFAIPVHLIELDNYGWAKALNACWDFILRIPADGERYILNLSTEVALEGQKGLSALLDAVRTDGASCGYALFSGRNEFSYRVPRNTCALWRASVWTEVGHFDTELDAMGGMEDFDLVLRAYQKRGWLPFPANHVFSVGIPNPEFFPRKLRNELDAIEIISKRYPEEIVTAVMSHVSTLNDSVLSGQSKSDSAFR